jgi:hypothetical protein
LIKYSCSASCVWFDRYGSPCQVPPVLQTEVDTPNYTSIAENWAYEGVSNRVIIAEGELMFAIVHFEKRPCWDFLYNL